jgi:hypothetical protein
MKVEGTGVWQKQVKWSSYNSSRELNAVRAALIFVRKILRSEGHGFEPPNCSRVNLVMHVLEGVAFACVGREGATGGIRPVELKLGDARRNPDLFRRKEFGADDELAGLTIFDKSRRAHRPRT